jgi:hypothetical protein
MVEKWHWGRFSPCAWVSPASSYSTDCSVFINHPVISAVLILTVAFKITNLKKEINWLVVSSPSPLTILNAVWGTIAAFVSVSVVVFSVVPRLPGVSKL